MDNALKDLIVNAVDHTYLKAKKTKYTGYHGVSAIQLMKHLMDRYGKVSEADLDANQNKLMESYNASQPIKMYYEKIEDCIQYAKDRGTTISTEQVMQTVYHVVHVSGLYNDACKKWRRRHTTTKTWEHFKAFFSTEYYDQQEQQRITSGHTHFFTNAAIGNANINIGDTLDNLALAATNDRDILNQLVASNKKH